MGLQSTFSRLRRLECRLMRRDAVNISVRGFSKKKGREKKKEEKSKSIRMAICMTLLEERTIRRIGVSLGRASAIKKQCMAAQLIRVNIKKSRTQPTGRSVTRNGAAAGLCCFGTGRGLRRAISCGAACRWSTAASGESEVTITVRKTIRREESS
jgi:hypothetical protein